MSTRPLFGAAALAALLAAGAAPAQNVWPTNYLNRGGTPAMWPGGFVNNPAAFAPYYYASMYIPTYNYYWAPNDNLRPNYWSLPGRYSAYPYSGAGVYTTFQPPWASWWGTSLPYWSPVSWGWNGFGGYFGGGQLAYPTSNDPLFQADTPAMSYREPMRASPAAPADRAVLALQVPADAKIWVQGEATKQDGAVRTFVSPPLEPGKTYTYAVKAQWTENGKPVEQSQNVTVRAGNRSQLLFLPRGS